MGLRQDICKPRPLWLTWRGKAAGQGPPHTPSLCGGSAGPVLSSSSWQLVPEHVVMTKEEVTELLAR